MTYADRRKRKKKVSKIDDHRLWELKYIDKNLPDSHDNCDVSKNGYTEIYTFLTSQLKFTF